MTTSLLVRAEAVLMTAGAPVDAGRASRLSTSWRSLRKGWLSGRSNRAATFVATRAATTRSPPNRLDGCGHVQVQIGVPPPVTA